MSQYATLMDLIYRADGDEIVQRGLSHLRATYRQEVPAEADLDSAVADPRIDDIALVAEDGLLYLYNGVTWSAIPTPKIDRALLDASAFADDFLRGRYLLPLAGIPRTLTLMVCDIARYYLYDDAATETVERRYKDAHAWLIKIANGTVTLDGTEAEPKASSTGSAHISGSGRVFSRGSMEGL